MYSGLTLTRFSGFIMGAHQKIDRSARKNLDVLIHGEMIFPSANKITHFEGKNGPDAIKRKSPARDEPWHFYSPFDSEDSKLIELIRDHYNRLVLELKNKNEERIAFEAAWLAHAITDGLTPAHHYPFEEKLLEISGGKALIDRTSVFQKWIIPGITRRDQLKNNWKMWGSKGLITTHGLFELGVAFLMMPSSYSDAIPTKSDLDRFNDVGLVGWFTNTAREVAVLDIYNLFYRRGWTPKLAYLIRQKLGPSIVKTVTLAWYSALIDAGLVKEAKTK